MVKKPRFWDIPQILQAFVLSPNGVAGVVSHAGYLSPGLIAAASTLPLAAPRYEPFLARRQKTLGLALTKQRRETDQLDLSWLLLRDGQETTTAGQNGEQDRGYGVVSELLEAVCRSAAEQGFVSVFARLPENCDYLQAFGEHGFNVVVREHTYLRDPGSAPRSAAIQGLRPQEKHDAWSVQQLYRACSPAAIQLAENLTSRTWESPQKVGFKRLGAPIDSHSFVVEGQHVIDGWLRITRFVEGPDRLDLLVHPAAASLVAPLLDFALAWLADYPPRLVLTTVRDYETWKIQAVEASGFQPKLTRLLMVRHLGIRFKAPVLERAFGRVPN